jgi:hypothetical protein
VGEIPEQVTDPDVVLTYNAITGMIEYLDTSGWDKDGSDDLTEASLLWTLTDEQLHPKNALWHDLILGGTSTASATIALQAETGDITAQGDLTVIGAGDFTGSLVTAGTVTADSYYIRDTGDDHSLNLVYNENATANRTLNLALGDADRALTLTADVALDQNLRTTDSPTFSNLALTNQGELRLMEATGNGSFYTGFKAPADLTANTVYTLPTGMGTTGQILRVKDNNTGELEWVDVATGDPTYFTLTDQQVHPKNALWHDVLVGGTSTASASIALQAETGNIKASSLNLGTNNLSLSGATIGISSDLDLLTLGDNLLTLSGALQLGAYTPGDTSNKLYMSGGSIYWAGEKICVEGGPCASTGTVAYDGTPLTGQVAFFTDGSTITGSSDYFWNNTQKLLGLGTNQPAAKLEVTGGYGSNALVILNQDNDGNILTASASGITVMNLTNTGNLELWSSAADADGLRLVPHAAGDNSFTGTLTSEDLTSNRTWTLPDKNGTIAMIADVEGSVGSINYWNLSNEQLSPKNADWIDLMIGGASTASATIALQAETGNITSIGNLLLNSGALGINSDSNQYNFLGVSQTGGAADNPFTGAINYFATRPRPIAVGPPVPALRVRFTLPPPMR